MRMYELDFILYSTPLVIWRGHQLFGTGGKRVGKSHLSKCNDICFGESLSCLAVRTSLQSA